MSPEEHASGTQPRSSAAARGTAASDSIWVIGDEIGHMMELTPGSGFGAVQEFVWDMGTNRYPLACASSFAANRSWPTIADSVERTDADASVEPETVEPTDADASVEPTIGRADRRPPAHRGAGGRHRGLFPADWDVEVKMEPQEVALPSEYEDAPPPPSGTSSTHPCPRPPAGAAS